MIETLLLPVAVFLAFFLKRLIGFGNALILNSLFAFVSKTQFTAAMDLILVFPINIYMVWKERKGLNLKTTFPILISTLIGSSIGIMLLHVINDKILKIILSIVIILTSINLAFKDNKEKENTPIKNILWSVGSGILLGLYGIAALLAVHIQKTFVNKERYRSNLCLILVVDNIYRLIMYSINGIINKTVLIYSGYMLPLALLAIICGSLIDKKVNEKIIKKIVISLLFISGLMILVLNLF
ncbi:MAG: sulfite exporter TauE/SafE family protein [Clostridiaceae bacterium]